MAATDLGQVGPLSVKNRSKDSGSSSAGNPDSCSRWASDRNRTGIRRLYDSRYGATRPTVALVSSPLMLLPEDKRGLTPLFWAHVAPYGEVKLDMGRRLALHADTAPEAQ